MDAELCQLDKLYLTDLADYNHVLNQRNKLLKDMYRQPELGSTFGCMGHAAGYLWTEKLLKKEENSWKR